MKLVLDIAECKFNKDNCFSLKIKILIIMSNNIIISLDIEATGDSPATSSCVMIGAVAMYDNLNPDENEYIIDKKQWCIEEQDGKPIDKRCWDEFWLKNMNVWEHIQKNKKHPKIVINEFGEWYSDLLKNYDNVKFVMKPASYDWQWVNALYSEYRSAESPNLPYSCLCLSTIYSFVEKCLKVDRETLKEITKCKEISHTHFADDDAHEQGYSYLKLKWLIKNSKFELNY